MSSLSESFRASFPIFENRVYLNSCSQGALSVQVRAAYSEFLEGWETYGAQWGAWTERNELVRAAFADLINAPVDSVAVTTSVLNAATTASHRANAASHSARVRRA